MDLRDELDNGRFAQLCHYLADELSADDRAEVDAWLAADPDRGEALRFTQRLLDQSATAIVDRESGLAVDVDAALARFLAGRRPMGVRPIRRILPVAARIAAALLLAVGGTLLYRRHVATAPQAPAPVAMRDHATPRGRRADFHLADGTHVLLSVASRLRVPADFGARSRDVYLEGEAYFEVTHDSTRRFVVHTATASTEDLGTRFGVRAYAADGATRVVVAEGRVGVRSPAPESGASGESVGRLLGAGQGAEVAANGAVIVQEHVDAQRLLAWTDGRLVFDNTPLRDALVSLERWYDVDIHLADASIAGRRFTAVFHDEGATEALRLIARSLDLTVDREGRSVTLRDAASASAPAR